MPVVGNGVAWCGGRGFAGGLGRGNVAGLVG